MTTEERKAQTERMKAEYIRGDSTTRIAWRYGLSQSAVWNRLNKAGVEMRPAGSGKRGMDKANPQRPTRYCLECQAPVPAERHGNAQTCSKVCTLSRKARKARKQTPIRTKHSPKPAPKAAGGFGIRAIILAIFVALTTVPSAANTVEETAAIECDAEHCTTWLRDARGTRNERRGLIVRCLLQREWNLAVAYDEALAIVPRIGGGV